MPAPGAAPNACEDCTLCCRLLPVEGLDKPANVACRHLGAHGGCGVYSERPDACRFFQCVWLNSRTRRPASDALPDALRPDRCHVVLGPRNWRAGGDTLFVHVDPDHPEAWRRGAMRDYLRGLASRGVKLVICIGREQVRVAAGGAAAVRGTEAEFAGTAR